MKPTNTANHNVKNLTITAIARVVFRSMPSNVNNPAKLPSITPKPPGDIEAEPIITDIEYMLNKLKNFMKSIPNAASIRIIPTDSINRKTIVNPEHEQTVLISEEVRIILCDSSAFSENFLSGLI